MTDRASPSPGPGPASTPARSIPPPLPPGATLGVLGGGQLGRMFVHAAQRLGYRTVVLDPDGASPAGEAASEHLQADYGDTAALDRLAARCDAITLEFENVPADAVRHLAALRPVAPGAEALAVCQDRAREKRHFAACGVPCAPHAVIDRVEDLAAVEPALLPGILKTARMGYDGKGQRSVVDRPALADAFAALGGVPCVLEQRLPLAAELSVVVARGRDGATVHLPPMLNTHQAGILARTEVPVQGVDPALCESAVRHAAAVARSFDYVGVLCVEFFVLADGSLVANEMAPRPHNSGHYSIDACSVSQFELQVRALAGLPLAEPRLAAPAVMLNLLGDLWFPPAAGAEAPAREPDWPGVLALPGAALHLYGKREARRGRKMGHLTVTGPTLEAARATAAEAAARLGRVPSDA